MESLAKVTFAHRGEREKVSQRGLGGFPHERLANSEGVKGERANKNPLPFTPYPFPHFCKKSNEYEGKQISHQRK